MDLLEGFLKFLKTNHLPLGDGTATLLALSGGLDSMVLMDLFCKANIPFAIAHCNFQLRGEESEDDEHFVQKVAQGRGAPFYVKRFETSHYATENGLSIQMAARELRYAWFAEIADEQGYSSISTAHHLNDSVETALLNFVRGTALPGLSGIAPKAFLRFSNSENLFIRPLLFATRKEILEYAQANQVAWREDSSNASDDYARNFVRHHIVPKLEELNPNFLQTAARNLKRIKSADQNLSFFLNGLLKAVEVDSQSSSQTVNAQRFSIDKHTLAKLPSPRQALRQLLQPYGFDAEQVRQLAEGMSHVGLELHAAKGFKALIDREQILLSSSESQVFPTEAIYVQEDDLMITLPDRSRIFFLPVYQTPINQSPITDQPILQLPDNQSTELNAEKLKYPLSIRHWQPGDYFQPFGMGGKSQKLQDFFTNQKLSRFEKEEVWLLVNGDGVVIWVAGHRLDERFRVGEGEASRVVRMVRG